MDDDTREQIEWILENDRVRKRNEQFLVESSEDIVGCDESIIEPVEDLTSLYSSLQAMIKSGQSARFEHRRSFFKGLFL